MTQRGQESNRLTARRRMAAGRRFVRFIVTAGVFVQERFHGKSVVLARAFFRVKNVFVQERFRSKSVFVQECFRAIAMRRCEPLHSVQPIERKSG